MPASDAIVENAWTISGKTGGVVRGEQVDLEVLLAGLGEQRLGGLDVLLTLRQVVADVGRVERAVEVVGDAAVAAEHLVDHRLTVDDEAHRLADADVGERLLVDGHEIVSQPPPAALSTP